MQRNMHNENKLKMKKKNSERTTIMGDNCFKYPGENSHHIQTPFKIYIYDIPKKFNDDIIKCHENPKINECTIKLSDCGYGPTMAHVGHYPNISIHETDQFSLEVVMHNKLLLSPYRTLDPQKADIFYIPAYIGLYCLTFNKCNNITTLNLVKQLFQYLKQMPFYASGKPHFSALGKINREQVLFPCDHLRHPYTHNMTFLSIEREYIVNEYLPKLPKQSIIVVPYPSYAHLRYGNSNSTITVNSLNKREVTVFLAASRHRNNKFRNMIMDQFPIRTSNTYYYYIQKRPSLQTEMVMLDTTGCLIHPQATIPWMRHSIFCLQPPGDSPTRKSFYDAIVSGCIPVIFSSQSHVVYPFENVLDYSDFIYAIPEAKILQGQYVKDILDSIPKTRIAELHKNVVKVTKWLQYSEFKSNIVEHNDAVQLILDELKLLHNL